MAHSWEKSQFLAEETRRRRGWPHSLLPPLTELAPAAQEVANLRVREKDAHDDTREAEEKLTALIERARTDAVEAKRLRKEQDDLL